MSEIERTPENMMLQSDEEAEQVAEKPHAVFMGWQEFEGYPTIEEFPIYNIVGGVYDKSTVSAHTILKLGIELPKTPSLQAWRESISGAGKTPA